MDKIVFLKSLSGKEAASATEIAPRMLPSIATCRHDIGMFSFVSFVIPVSMA
jgi:hypothetical protein